MIQTKQNRLKMRKIVQDDKNSPKTSKLKKVDKNGQNPLQKGTMSFKKDC